MSKLALHKSVAKIRYFNYINTIDMRKSIKGTTIIISHQERILNIADEIVLINAGKIQEYGSKKEMLDLVLNKPCCKLGGNASGSN